MKMYAYSITFLLVFCFSINALFAQSKIEKYHQILVQNDRLSTQQKTQLDQMPFLHDCGSAIDQHQHAHPIILSESEIEQLDALQIPYTYSQKDMQQFYQERLIKHKASKTENHKSAPDIPADFSSYPTPQHFSLGSMGGYLTHEEILAHLDQMKSLYPDLISTKKTNTDYPTHDGNYVYWVKISDHPEMDEGEPQAMYTALHHAREPMSVMQMIYFMYYLLENYETNPMIKYLVDERELFFFPCLNPDGYLYNQEIAPDGGGLWRKNRRPNEDGSFGVDLNRNYAFKWGYNDQGSSGETESNVYRGTAAFSEPELKVIRDFCNSHEIKICLNYHSYGELLIHPWGYEDLQPDPVDQSLFNAYSQRMTWQNRYKYGNGVGAINYYVNGEADDWMYGERESKDKIIAFTPEVGSYTDGFWPTQDRIIPLCQEQMLPNLEAAHYAGNYLAVDYLKEPWLDDTGIIQVDILNLGLTTDEEVQLSFLPIDEQLDFFLGSYTFAPPNTGERISFGASYDVELLSDPVIEFGIQVNQGSFQQKNTYTKTYQPTIVFEDDFENDLTKWEGKWDISSEKAANGLNCLTDSPNADSYGFMDNYSIHTTTPIDLRNANNARLTFLCQWDIERRYDVGEVIIKTYPDGEWTSLPGNYTKVPSSFQEMSNYVYDGLQTDWVLEEINLDAYTGQEVLIGFQMHTNLLFSGDGFFVDDVEVFKWQDEETDVSVKLFLEGSYDNEQTLLTSPLKEKDLLPNTQPYNQGFWAYNETDILPSNTDLIPEEFIDWVLVEVRDAADLTQIVDRQTALLGEDGFLRSIDGQSFLTFSQLPANQDFHLFVRHRNHIDIMSSLPFQSSQFVTFDFTTDATSAYGDNQLKAIAPNTFAMIAGDIDGDGTITTGDYNAYLSKAAIINEYLPEDLNLDGVVSVQDFNLFQQNIGHIGASEIRY